MRNMKKINYEELRKLGWTNDEGLRERMQT